MAKQETTLVFGAVDKVTPVLRGIEQQVKGLGTAFTAVAAGGLAGVAAVVTKTVGELDRLGDTARSLNTTTEALSALGFAATLSGSSAETLTAGLARLNKTLGDAATGNKQAAQLFDALGVSIRDAQGRVISADEALLQVADRFKSFEDGAGEAAIATQLFGRAAGPELLQFLNQGREGIGELTDEAARLGVVVGTDAANAAGEFNDRIDKLKAVATGLANELTSILLPALTAVADALLKIADFGEAATGALDNGFGGRAKNAIDQLARDIGRAEAELQSLREAYAQDPSDELLKQIQALQNYINNTERTLTRLRTASDKAKDAARQQAAEQAKVPPPIIRTGAEAEKAAKKIDTLRFSVERLRDPNRDFYDSLEITRREMQGLVEDIDLGAVSFGNLGESLEVLNATTTEEAQFFQDNWQGAVGAVQDAFADFVAGNIKSFEDFGDALESIARQFLSNLVRQFLSTNLSFGGLNLGGLFGGGSGAAGASGGGGLFGGFNFGGPGAGFGTRLGLGATGAAVAYQGYQSGNPLLGAAGGALTGFQIAGPVGAAIGAIIGGLASALNDTTRRINVIGDDLVGTPGFRNLAPGSTFESRLGGFTFASIDNVSADERRQIGQSVVNFDNTIADLLNDEQLDKVTDALAGFNLRLTEGAISAENILGERFDAILSTFDQDIQDFVNGAATLEERTERLAEILSRPARLNALLESLEEADRLAGMTPFEQALDRINKEFDAAAAAAEELGADQAQLARIEELRGNAIERLNELQRQNLDALLDDLRFDDLTEGLSPVDKEVAAINRRFDALRQQAIDLGASQEDLELIERRRTAAIREATDATRESTDAIADFAVTIRDDLQVVRDFERDFLGSLENAIQGVRNFLSGGASVSSLNPLERLQQSQQQFEDLARRASLGDIDAIRQISGGADRFLQQAAAFYGVGSADFQRYEQLVRGTLQPLAGVNTGDSMAVALAQLRQVYEALLRFLQGNGNPNGVMPASVLQSIDNSLKAMSREKARAY